MEISFCSHPSTNIVIATKFCTWHDSWAVVTCAKFCCDMINCNWIRAKWIFHRIWIVMEKVLVKWVPGSQRYPARRRASIRHFRVRSMSVWCRSEGACCLGTGYCISAKSFFGQKMHFNLVILYWIIFGQISSISGLTMSYLVSPGHRQAWNWVCASVNLDHCHNVLMLHCPVTAAHNVIFKY